MPSIHLDRWLEPQLNLITSFQIEKKKQAKLKLTLISARLAATLELSPLCSRVGVQGPFYSIQQSCVTEPPKMLKVMVVTYIHG
jgi:hypothetical protein